MLPSATDLGKEGGAVGDDYRLVFECTDVAFCLLDILFDVEGRPYDYVVTNANQACLEQTGYQPTIGSRASEREPRLEPFWLEMFGEVARTGAPMHYKVHSDRLNGWFEGHVFRIKPEFTLVGVRYQRIPSPATGDDRYAIISRFTNDAVYDLDLVRSTLWWDEGLKRLFGHPSHAIQASLDWWNQQIHPDDRARVDRSLNQALAGDATSWEEEYRFARADATYADVHDRGYILRDEAGHATRMVGGMSDITTAKSAAAALRMLQEETEKGRSELNAVVTTMTEGVVIFDAHGTILNVNPAALQMHHCQREDLVGSNMADVLEHWELRHLNGALFAPKEWPMGRVMRGETFNGVEAIVQNFETEHIFIASFGGAPVALVDGRVSIAVVTMHDITREKEAEASLRRSRDALEQANRELEKRVEERTAKLRASLDDLEHFSYALTHDLRGPLRTLQAFGKLLRDEHDRRLEPEGRDYLRRIVSAAERMDRLVTDALDYTKVLRGEQVIEPVDPGALLHGILETYPDLQSPRATIAVAPALPTVLGSTAGLTQCFSNLLQNAVKFVAPGVQPVVAISAETRGEVVRLWFEDNGIGIPPEHQDRIFEMFQRLSQTYEGTGIGLPLVKKLVERMDGRVGVVSQVGHGSKFWIELPRAPATQHP